MPKRNKQIVAVFIVLAGVLLIVGMKLLLRMSHGPEEPSLRRTKGNPRARIQVVEYLDFGCPACAVGVDVLNTYLKQYPQDIFISLKYFPLHEMTSAVYAECSARQDKFWNFTDRLFSQQAEWKKSKDRKLFLDQIIKDIGLEQEEFQACLQDESVLAVIKECQEQGKAKGIRSTPTFFVNGKMMIGPSALKSALEENL